MERSAARLTGLAGRCSAVGRVGPLSPAAARPWAPGIAQYSMVVEIIIGTSPPHPGRATNYTAEFRLGETHDSIARVL